MPSNKVIFFLCMYKMVDISVITWNQAEVAAANIHEDHDVNKTILLIIVFLMQAKDGVVKIFMT